MTDSKRPFSGIVLLLLAVVAIAQDLEPCNSFTPIGNEKRSTLYLHDDSLENPLCDYSLIPDRWYSFDARTGGEIPETTSVPVYHCGTVSPIFIKQRADGQRYHTIAKTTRSDVNAQACSNYGYGDPCASWTATVVIRWCEQRSAILGHDAFIYKLTPPPGCSLAYCAGEGVEPCPAGYYWNEVQQKCTSGYPRMTRPPFLRGPTISSTEVVLGSSKGGKCGDVNVTVQQFSFYCDIAYTQQLVDDGARFRVYLAFDGQVAEDIIIIGNSTNVAVQIEETRLQGRLGKALQCWARSYWESNTPYYSDPLSSNSYWIGIQAPKVVDVVNDVVGTIPYNSTVPITCWHCFQKPYVAPCFCRPQCTYSFFIGKQEGQDKRKCMMTVYPDTRSGLLEVLISADANIPQSGTRYVAYFSPYNENTQFGSVLWTGYKLPNATLQVNSTKTNLCSSTGDPHITTITGIVNHNYLLGEFRLLYSKVEFNNDMYLQIEVRHMSCGYKVSCNCAIIVREANTAVGIDACVQPGAPPVSAARVVYYLKPSYDDGTSVWRDATGSEFQISMPSGLLATVYYRAAGKYIDIYLNIPSKYFGKTAGMCMGFTNEAEHRIPKGTSMFDGNIACQSVNSPSASICECDKMQQCEVRAPGFGATNQVSPLTTGMVCNSKRRKRRSVWTPKNTGSMEDSDSAIDLGDAFYTIDYDPNHGLNPVYANIPDAEQRCRDTLTGSQSYQQCAGKFNIDQLVTDCATDMKISNDTLFTKSYISAMEKVCLDAVIKQSGASTPEEVAVNPGVAAVTNNMCPNQCSGRGTCSNGVCSCQPGFVGADCSVDASKPPTLTALYRDGMCDIQGRQCAKTSVYASNIYDSANMKCRFQRFSLLTGEPFELVLTVGQLNGFDEVICPSPDDYSPDSGRRISTGYKLSISNDGLLYSNEMILTVYDSTCLNCQQTGTYQQLNGTCFIEGLCYPTGDRQNTSVNCLTCLPSSNSTSWTDTATMGEWSECSRSCDLGVRQRQTVCSTGTVISEQNFDTETDFCSIIKCPARPAQRLEGVIITSSSDDVKTMLLSERTFFELIADAVNTYCGQNSTECCSSIGATLDSAMPSSASMNITTVDQCFYAAGYPVVETEPPQSKIIVNAYVEPISEQCQSGRAPGEYTEVFWNRELIQQAILQSKTYIENALDITIIDVLLE